MLLSKNGLFILTATLPFLFRRPWSITSVFSLIFGISFATSHLNGQPPSDSTPAASLPLSEFRPLARLKVKQTPIQSAKLPVIDIHTHFQIRLRHDPTAFANFLEVMNRNRIAICISLDGTLGPKLTDHLEFLNQRAPNRFAVFANIDFIGRGEKTRPETWDCNQANFVGQTCEQLRAAQRLGVVGLKFFKQFGLEYRNSDGSLIAIDDPRFDPIWQTCGDLHLPIIMHTADPSAFFLPIDKSNERFEELARHPDWAFPQEKFPTRETLHAARNRVVAKHPHTIFIAAHLANDGEDLEATGQLLDTYPNLYVEIASRIAELGRQPFTARKFLMKYQDRVLFGTDGPWPEERLRLYWRFLETDDEYFPYSEKEFPPQGFWNIYGVQLPEEVLSKIYRDNALHILPNLKARYTQALKEMK
jgi:predicted TIM-barrel fold metal-dependent hydrolase